ncbi:hypothetical protein [Ancylomarina sp. 16SWW S1-10-2]|uniref:hypothetical protein n=1 Tax=Ancylomarina sp. 16SWW S1-10-2 TaxID=2499681 RepID=UPI0012AE1366|nr:hypothetical protein [Ancylomarina sp. 16SWW S1-10-2]MRT92811.1 hypothetical protein [Ancylomarina sp. 16SWW S1-10-2]
MKYNKLALILALNFLICNAIFGQSSELTSKVCKNLDLNIEDCYLSLVSEKAMPNDPSKSIIVLPKVVEKEFDYFILDSYVLIVESTTGKIISKYFESHKTNNWTSDAIKLESIKIDTAPYMLNKSTRAFGIRVSYSGSSRVNPYSEETLTLFIEKEETIFPVLNKYSVALFNGEWDGVCTGSFKDQEKIVIVAKEKSNGFTNILVKNKITETTNVAEADDCIEKEKIRTVKEVLKYDGKVYKNVL